MVIRGASASKSVRFARIAPLLEVDDVLGEGLGDRAADGATEQGLNSFLMPLTGRSARKCTIVPPVPSSAKRWMKRVPALVPETTSLVRLPSACRVSTTSSTCIMPSRRTAWRNLQVVPSSAWTVKTMPLCTVFAA